jgi:hypothetical protein
MSSLRPFIPLLPFLPPVFYVRDDQNNKEGGKQPCDRAHDHFVHPDDESLEVDLAFLQKIFAGGFKGL